MNRPVTYLGALLLGISVVCASGEDAAPAAAPKDPVCKADPKTGAECHAIPGSRTTLLKSYLAQHGQLPAPTSATNVSKASGQPALRPAPVAK